MVAKRSISVGSAIVALSVAAFLLAAAAAAGPGVVVTNIDEGESIQINTMLMPKTVQLGYTYSTLV